MDDNPVLKHGIDIVSLERFARTLKAGGEDLAVKLFCQGELRRNTTTEQLAGVFAAKEAFLKAHGADIPINFREIEIKEDRHGRPYYIEPNDILSSYKQVSLSISHDGMYAVASCILLG